MYLDTLMQKLLSSYAISPAIEDISERYIENYVDWTKELGKDIILFGHCAASEKLVKRFPDSFSAIVDINPRKKGKRVGTVAVISFEDYLKTRRDKIIITDVRYQYVYIDLLYYTVLRPAGAVGVKELWDFRIRYNYELERVAYGNNPAVFDYEYLGIKNKLPMACTIPVDSIIRLMDCIRTSVQIDGDILEVGTGEGGSTYYMASVLAGLGSKKKIFSVDGFEPQAYIPHLNYETVANNLACFPFVHLIKGYAPQALVEHTIDKIAFAFIDLYAFPDIMEYVYPKVSAGGIILIDNYNHGCYHNHGMPLANMFFFDKKEKIVRVGGSQGLIVKQ